MEGKKMKPNYRDILIVFLGLPISAVIAKITGEVIWPPEPSLEERIAKTVEKIRPRLPLNVDGGGAVLGIAHRGKTVIYKIKLNDPWKVLFGPSDLRQQVTREVCANQRPLLKLGAVLEFRYVALDRDVEPIVEFVVTAGDCEQLK
jgi:hypothetical protein